MTPEELMKAETENRAKKEAEENAIAKANEGKTPEQIEAEREAAAETEAKAKANEGKTDEQIEAQRVAEEKAKKEAEANAAPPANQEKNIFGEEVVGNSPPPSANEDIFKILSEKLGRQISSYEDLNTTQFATEEMAVADEFVRRTNRPLQDYFRSQRKWEELSESDKLGVSINSLGYEDVNSYTELHLKSNIQQPKESDFDMDEADGKKAFKLEKDRYDRSLKQIALEKDRLIKQGKTSFEKQKSEYGTVIATASENYEKQTEANANAFLSVIAKGADALPEETDIPITYTAVSKENGSEQINTSAKIKIPPAFKESIKGKNFAEMAKAVCGFAGIKDVNIANDASSFVEILALGAAAKSGGLSGFYAEAIGKGTIDTLRQRHNATTVTATPTITTQTPIATPGVTDGLPKAGETVKDKFGVTRTFI